MKRLFQFSAAFLIGAALFSGCEPVEAEENFVEVIGEFEQPSPESGYRLNLSYNGPMTKRDGFAKWVDSVQQQVPSMVKLSENIYVNYLPEEMNRRPGRNDMHTSISYLLTASDSTLYNRLVKDLLKTDLPFSINVMGTYIDPARKTKLQQEMMEKAVENAKQKIEHLSGDNQTYKIVSIEELDNVTPYGPEYYDINRRMVSRVKVKARLN
ncbi:SIMPL domain-containing protein [Pontibacter cellulosilyticus]|uniref:SIMPL domain-containing protein n=1 Tax=Pontibacter cellulosilyticus TaxID=1720253 RepID=A0A923N8E8_9BACT|nr:SIMPL domain-containing protein [Pontibacter cellulosilyticus]MBC5992360.1 SIMPL domain-containing protein [Pontibacter cellulosilyticus]